LNSLNYLFEKKNIDPSERKILLKSCRTMKMFHFEQIADFGFIKNLSLHAYLLNLIYRGKLLRILFGLPTFPFFLFSSLLLSSPLTWIISVSFRIQDSISYNQDQSRICHINCVLPFKWQKFLHFYK
jgi:hypothetical protein